MLFKDLFTKKIPIFPKRNKGMWLFNNLFEWMSNVIVIDVIESKSPFVITIAFNSSWKNIESSVVKLIVPFASQKLDKKMKKSCKKVYIKCICLFKIYGLILWICRLHNKINRVGWYEFYKRKYASIYCISLIQIEFLSKIG